MRRRTERYTAIFAEEGTTVSSAAPNDFAFLPATEQLAALNAKEISSAELVELYLSRITVHNPPLNAVVTVDAEGACRAAKQADAARSEGQSLGPLHGWWRRHHGWTLTGGLPVRYGSREVPFVG